MRVTLFRAGTAALMLTGASAALAADANHGKELFVGCAACHTEKGDGIGPSLKGVYGRKSAAIEDFRYSNPMKRANLVWNDAEPARLPDRSAGQGEGKPHALWRRRRSQGGGRPRRLSFYLQIDGKARPSEAAGTAREETMTPLLGRPSGRRFGRTPIPAPPIPHATWTDDVVGQGARRRGRAPRDRRRRPRDAGAQTFPSQLVRIVVPFTAGSQTDILGRAYADKLQDIWKRDVIVENKPGLAGTATTAKAPADGHTLLLVSNGHAMIESLNANLTFDPVKDFAGIAKIAVIPGILVVNPDSGPKTIKELVDARQGEARRAQLCLRRPRQRLEHRARALEGPERAQHRARAVPRSARRPTPASCAAMRWCS